MVVGDVAGVGVGFLIALGSEAAFGVGVVVGAGFFAGCAGVTVTEAGAGFETAMGVACFLLLAGDGAGELSLRLMVMFRCCSTATLRPPAP